MGRMDLEEGTMASLGSDDRPQASIGGVRDDSRTIGHAPGEDDIRVFAVTTSCDTWR
jgi:hypothetical protein